MPLVFADKDREYEIVRVGGSDDVKRFLSNLGFIPGAKVTVLSSMDGDLVVKILDSRVAINKDMAKHIMI